MKKGLWFLGIMAVLGLLFFACGEGSDTKKVDRVIAERLLDALQFEGGSSEDGAPPVSDPNGPSITNAVFPSGNLVVGQPFEILLTTPVEGVSTAVIRAMKNGDMANKHIKVINLSVNDQSQLVIRGQLFSTNDYIGEENVMLGVALLDLNGIAGNYQGWDVRPPDPPELTPTCQSIIEQARQNYFSENPDNTECELHCVNLFYDCYAARNCENVDPCSTALSTCLQPCYETPQL